MKRISMDALLQILIPDSKVLEGLDKRQKILYWEGIAYPQEPATYHWGQYIILVPSQLQPFVRPLLPSHYTEKVRLCLDIQGEGLDLLEREVNGEEIDWFGQNFDTVLSQILEACKSWVVIFEPHYDQIDKIYELE